MTRSPFGLADPARESAVLLAIIDAIGQGLALEPLSDRVARLIVESTETDICFVHVLDDTGRSLTLTGATSPFDLQVGKVKLNLDEGVTGWVARHREPAVLVEGKQADPRYRYIPGLRGTEYTSMASVPIASDEAGLVGVLNVHTIKRREFTERDLRILTTIGSLFAGAVHAARLHRRLGIREQLHERFAEQVIEAQENERRRVAADIHDGISQRLVSLSYHLDAALQALADAPESAAADVARARELTDEALEEARLAIGALRPPVLDDLGLRGGLTSLARTVPEVRLALELSDRRLAEHVEVALYRIAQEALQNVVKHAQSATVSIRFDCTESLALLEVRDDGVGFDSESNAEPNLGITASYGMATMSERAELVGGHLEVWSVPGRGTAITVRIPLAGDGITAAG